MYGHTQRRGFIYLLILNILDENIIADRVTAVNALFDALILMKKVPL